MNSPYFPRSVFSTAEHVPRAMIAPGRYIQGEGALDHLGRYLSLVPATRAVVLISSGGIRRVGDRVKQTLAAAGIDFYIQPFDGECSYEEAEDISSNIRQIGFSPDCLIAIGGGKCIDIGKAIAFRLNVPIVVCPTIASTDAPTSAVAVMYRPDGMAIGGEFYRHSPALVVVDSGIVATAPPRFLAAGIADALASVYEVQVNVANPHGRSMIGARPTFTVQAITRALGELLLREGALAVQAVYDKRVTPELENVIEVNTLGSGIGFESGGLAVVHAIAKGLTAVDSVREHYLHGELVAIGILTQLLLLDDLVEAQKVATLFNEIGLPIHLGGLGLEHTADLSDVVMMALDTPFVGNVGPIGDQTVSADLLLAALQKVDQFGRAFAENE